jgi:hypothetical protein
MPKIKRKKRLKQKSKSIFRKYAPVCCKSLFHHRKATATTTPSGLTYKIVQKEQVSNQLMVVFYFHYAGYFEDGNLFDSSYEDVNKAYGTFDENRAAQNGYQAFPFQAGKKDGMIPDFGRIKSDVLWGQSGLIHSF